MKYDRLMVISAYTAPGEILMINLAQGMIERSDIIEPTVAVIDLASDDTVLGIEVLDRRVFDLAAVAAEYGIEDLIPQIEAAIAVAKPGP